MLSTNPIQYMWGLLYDGLHHRPVLLLTVVDLLGFFPFFYAFTFFLLFCDITGKFRQYKIQPEKNSPVNMAFLKKVWKQEVMNHVVILVLLPILNSVKIRRGCNVSRTVPSLGTVALEFIGCVVVQEIYFYAIHRLFHHRLFYKRFHKVHHENSVIGNYTTLVDFIFADILSVFLGGLIFGVHSVTTFAFLHLAAYINVVHHCGYNFPGFSSAEYHDYHHKEINVNYGIYGVMDWMMGTDKSFRESATPTTVFYDQPIPISKRKRNLNRLAVDLNMN